MRSASIDIWHRTGMQVLYDGFGRPANVAQGARQHTLTFGSDGHADTLSDALARTIRYDRDPLGHITQVHAPDDSIVAFGFDALGDTMRVTPPGRPAHRVERDIVGRVRSYLAPDVGASTSRTTFDYNLEHQLTDVTAPDGASIRIGYDFAGRPSHITIAEGVIEASYDGAGRLSALDAPGDVGLAFGYDGGLRTDISWTGPVVGAIHRTFDNNFRVASASVNGEPAVIAVYDDDGLATRVGALNMIRDEATGRVNQTTVGSVAETYTFNELGELASSAATCGGVALREMSVTRDAAGTITTKNETLLGQDNAITYDHDSLGRLVAVQGSAGTTTYTYDSNGNRLSAVRAETTTYSYDEQDRLTHQGATTYAYTAAGHLSSRTSGPSMTTYSYDLLGNLRSVQPPSGQSIAYIVDGMNRRIGKLVGGVLQRGYLYENAINIVAELDGSGALISRFVYGTRAHVPDYMIKSGATYRILSDHVGSPRLVVDVASCEIVQRIDYDEFGRIVADTNPGFQPFGFAGGLHDRDTGLVRFGARDYDPEVGRWTAKDPIGFGGGDSNLYAYAANNPINFVDPTGLDFWQGLTDFSAGFGDTITFGLTKWVRQKLDVDSVVNPCSGWYTAGGVSGMVVETIATAGLGTEALLLSRGDDAIRGFRAVSKAERDDIAKFGFRPHPEGKSMTEKWFSETKEGAEWFRDNLSGLDDIVEARVPRAVYERSFKHPNIDRTGPGFCVACADLPLITPVLK